MANDDENYIILRIGDITQEGDEFFYKNVWNLIIVFFPIQIGKINIGRYRRKITHEILNLY